MGGGHGDHHHHHAVMGETPLTKVPDWRIYKVEDVPELLVNQRVLAQKGLKDPWARNHVWKYLETSPFEWGKPRWGPYTYILRVLGRGFSYGLVATALTVTGEYVYEKYFRSKDEHGHGHSHKFRII